MVDPGIALLARLHEKSGKTADEFVALAKTKGFDDPATTWGTLMTWLKGEECGLGHGYAMAVTHYIQEAFGLK